MGLITGANNPNNGAHVNSRGEVEAHAVSATEQEIAARNGDAYNFNTGTLTLTDDLDTPLFFLKNETEERGIVVTRIFVTFGASTLGVGEIEASVIYNPTAGDILTATEKAPQNFSAAQTGKTLQVTSTVGATLKTVMGGTIPIQFLFPSDGVRDVIPFQSIVLPRGASIAFTVKPPAGNTSMKVQVGYNAFLLANP